MDDTFAQKKRKILKTLGFDPENYSDDQFQFALDDAIYEQKDLEAAAINSEGRESQIEYLLSNGW